MNQYIWLNFLSKKLQAALMATALFCLFIPFGTKAQTNPTILVMGDSLSVEYGLVRGTGWVRLLEDQLQRQRSPWGIFNASISGETSAGGLSRLSKQLEQKKPGIVLLELGANDALRGLSIQESEKNLRKMIQLSKASGAKVLLFGMQIPPNYGQEYTKEFHDLYPKLARQEQVELVPFFLKNVASDINLFQADRMHPNEKAQVILFKNVWGAMAPYQTLLKSQ
ncbi:arylesterase [Polynucleobacter sp. AP-RePozz3-80-G7]|uniref:arylesterase n=1 Tax=Polynucleobacter sp. AP-RePozz3-80-G7 TaxID=2689105 RepID=UPI001C0D6EF9|nr:arylesterase [Polynucleobacter sp. AP-RePozz3-80-G7]